MRSARFLLGVIPFALCALACGSDSPSTPPDDDGPVTDATQVIEGSGGTIAVENGAGARLTLDVPEGALPSATSVRLRALETPAGKMARFAVEPSGLFLLEPATFMVTLPEGTTIDPSLGFVYERSERVPVPTVVDVDARTLTFSTQSLGFGDLSVFEGRELRTDAPAAAGEEFIDVEELGCQFLAESLDEAILRAQAFVGAFPPDLASPLIQEYRAALLACGADSMQGQVAAMEAIACDKAASAKLNAEVILVEDATSLKQSLGALLAAEGLVQLVGGDCGIQTSVFDTEFGEFLQAYLAHINGPDFVADFSSWDAIWRELVTCLEVAGLAQSFSATDAEATIFNELFPALFARLHGVAEEACEENEDNHFFLDLLTGGHERGHPVTPAAELPAFSGLSESEVVDDLHRCASGILLESTTRQGDPLDSGRISLEAGSGQTRVTSDGKVTVTSDVLNFLCGGILQRPPVRVRAELAGQLPVVTLGTLSSPLTVDVPTTLEALPQIEGALPEEFDLVFERDRAVCGIGGPGVIELCRIRVNTMGFEGAMSGVWSGGCPVGGVSGTFEIAIARDGNVTGTYAGSASGDITGTVTSNGSLDAIASGGPCNWTGTLSLAGGTLSGSGSWTCAADCSGGFSSTP